MEERMAQIKEEERLETLPKRPVYAETGSVTLPRFAFDWLAQSRDQSWTVADLGMLSAVLGMFENRQSLFANGTFAEEDGELVLTIPGGISEVRLLPGRNGNAVDSTGSGVVREREALRVLAHARWIDVKVEGTTLKIRLGEHAKKVREGTTTTA
jgi:hypothetical protein